MMMNLSKLSALSALTVAAGLAALVAGTAGVAFAQETQWQKDHPRRTEVNDRAKNQNQRIKAEEKSGPARAGAASFRPAFALPR